MPRSRLILLSSCLAALFSVARCAAPSSGPPATGTGGTSSTGGTTGTGGGTSSTGGSNANGGSTGTGGVQTTGTGGARGGTTGTGGGSSTGGNTGTGGGSSTGGSTGTGGASSTGGTTGTGGSPGTGGTTVDQGGVALATVNSGCLSGDPPTGPMAPTSPYYFNLGDMRLINNRWGSDKLGCADANTESVCIYSDGSFGWTFNRPACGGMRGDPDFPEVEFGVAPFGNQSSNLTSPTYSSTTLLPIQISALNSATLNLSNYNTTITSGSASYWDSNFEFWISKDDPTKTANAGVYAEIIMFLGYEPGRTSSTATPVAGWTCDHSGTVSAGGASFNLCHQSDTWASNQWRFFNFNLSNAPQSSFNGTVDIKAILSWVMSNYANSTASSGGGMGSFSNSMYLTRIEVGTEIDDSTAGSVKISNLTFNINGTSKSATFGH
jgi:hypothetical protein